MDRHGKAAFKRWVFPSVELFACASLVSEAASRVLRELLCGVGI